MLQLYLHSITVAALLDEQAQLDMMLATEKCNHLRVIQEGKTKSWAG